MATGLACPGCCAQGRLNTSVSWGGHTLPREQLNIWGGREAMTAGEGQTVISGPPATPGGCNFAIGMR